MTRRQYIERIRRLIYGGMPSDDATITVGLVNNYLPDAIGAAAKSCYKESLQLDGIAYVNNSFYTKFKNLSVVADEQFVWKITLPEIPVGIGANEGVSTLIFKDAASNQLSYPVIWVTENQRSFQKGMRTIPNKLLAYPEGTFVYVESTIQLSQYTAQVTMISGGNATDLDSILNVPPDYFPIMQQYIFQQLNIEHNQPKDLVNDGEDFVKST